jgi:hypothetical protein
MTLLWRVGSKHKTKNKKHLKITLKQGKKTAVFKNANLFDKILQLFKKKKFLHRLIIAL